MVFHEITSSMKVPQKFEEEQQILGEGFTEITAPPQGILQKRGETPPTKGAIINNNRTSSTLYQTALQSTSDDQNNETQNRNSSNKIQSTLPDNGEVNGKSDSLPTYQSIFANTLTRQQQHQQEGTVETTAAVSPISRLENGNHSNSIQNGNIQNSHIYNKSNYSPQRSDVITEMATSTPMTLNTTQTAVTNMGMPPSQYSHHHHPSPHSPLKFFREDSVDGTLSPVSSKSAGTDTDTDMRKKRYPTDRAYFIAKEILMTERTYKKDLEIINLWFRDEVSKEEDMPEDLLTLLFSHVDPIYELHCSFLKDIEQRMATWEGRGNAHLTGDYKRISDVVVRNFDAVTTEYYLKYVEAHPIILDRLEQTILKDSRFAQVVRDFESQKVCYLPLTTLIVKPLHRILHYDLLLERLLKHYNPSHPDYHSTNMALVKMQSIIGKMSVRLRETENFVKVAELQRDLGGIENLLQCDREFLREGCLQKLSRKGYQQRMFFLFSDVLIYANRTTNPSLHFRVHGTMTLKDLTVLDSEPRLGADFCFNLYDGKKAILLAAGSHAEKVFWMDDIAEAAQMSRERTAADHEDRMSSPLGSKNIVNLKAMSGSEDGLDRERSTSVQPPGIAGLDHHVQNPNISGGGQQRTNSSVHVCWHRSTTVAAAAHHRSMRSTLSGYLLRKFKSSNGWQKLWVVFTGACLYFFKTFQDDFPLASLPLLGYAVHKPDLENDQINKDYVFKLVFKNHVYFFRAESQYTFERWIEVLGSATKLSNEFTNTHGNGAIPIQGRY